MPNTFGDMAVQYMWHMPYQTFMLKNKKKYNRFNQKTKKIKNFLFLVDMPSILNCHLIICVKGNLCIFHI